MLGGKTCKQQDIVVAPVVYSDQSGRKRRPVLVLNRFGSDLLVCSLTSNTTLRKHHLFFGMDVMPSRLRSLSVVKLPSLSVIYESLVEYSIGRLNAETFNRVRQEFNALV